MKAHPDQAYIEGIVARDPGVIREIYAQNFESVARHIVRNSGNRTDAEDIFQDAMVAIFQRAKKEEFVLKCKFSTYLHAVCRNLWLNALKKQQRRGVTIEGYTLYKEGDDSRQLADETMLIEARDRFFWEKFRELGESCRSILRLSWSGTGMKEVSAKLSISYSYARKKKSECMERLSTLIRQAKEFSSLKEGR
jgi:RNA polymerase sigma factor (sigma-70 family)